ncbi:MAG: hypothetical protein HY023_12505, partial [Chloroflexi bacterium]|nr:hypothetical protein [Chloroflexota bacterium]
ITLRPPRLRRRAVHAILLVPSLASLLFTAYSFRAQSIGEMAIDSALEGNWKASAGQFDLAAQADPHFAFYWLESGYAYGVLAANGDAASLDAAIGRTERGLALEPDYALNHANLGALYWQAGRRDDAMREMRRAVELAPAASLFRLNVGLFEEATGDGDAALRDYRAALDLDPALAAGVLWPTTPLRASALDGWRAAREPDRPPRTAAQFTAKARSEIAASDMSSAERDLSAAWQIDSQSSAVYLGFAELALARAELSQADRYLRAALWVQTQSNAEKVAPLLAWAELAARQGDTDAALVRYRQAFDAVTDYTIFGWGSWGWNPYAWFVFQRRSLPVDVLPQLTRADFTPDLGRRLLALGALYESRGEDESALLVYRRLLANDPALTEARDRIARLSP